MKKSRKISVSEEIALVFGVIRELDQETIEKAIKGVEIRNSIVHYGKTATKDHFQNFLALGKCVKSLLKKNRYKYPVYTNLTDGFPS